MTYPSAFSANPAFTFPFKASQGLFISRTSSKTLQGYVVTLLLCLRVTSINCVSWNLQTRKLRCVLYQLVEMSPLFEEKLHQISNLKLENFLPVLLKQINFFFPFIMQPIIYWNLQFQQISAALKKFILNSREGKHLAMEVGSLLYLYQLTVAVQQKQWMIFAVHFLLFTLCWFHNLSFKQSALHSNMGNVMHEYLVK